MLQICSGNVSTTVTSGRVRRQAVTQSNVSRQPAYHSYSHVTDSDCNGQLIAKCSSLELRSERQVQVVS